MKIEVSNGEIVDKLTILEIKLRNSDCDQKSKQIVKEMSYLSPIVEELNIPDELIDNLRVVNQKLWDVEDALPEPLRQKNVVFVRVADRMTPQLRTSAHNRSRSTVGPGGVLW